MAAAGADVRLSTLLEPKSPQHGGSGSAEEPPAVPPGGTEEQALHRFTTPVLRAYSTDEPAITRTTISTHGPRVQLFRSLHPISESSALHCPDEILQAPALDENDAEVIGAMGWEENDIRDMFQPIMTALQVKIRHRLGVGRLDLSARHRSDNNKASDVIFTYKSKIFSFGDFKTSLAVNAKVFTQFPLGSTEPPLRLSASIVALFNQMAGDAKIIRKKWGDNSTLPEKETATLLTAFPSYIFIVVFHFPTGVIEPTIHVSRNLIKFTPPSGMEAKDVFLLNVFDHSHVFNYVKHMFWAQYIVTYHHVKDGVEHRYTTEEQYRGQNEGLILRLREAQSALGEVHTYPFTIKLIHSIDNSIKTVWYMVPYLLHHLLWQSGLTSQMRINGARRVELLGHHTLAMDYAKPQWRLMEYLTRRFWPLILSEGVHWQSSWEYDKRFFLYRHCNLFIKIYGPSDKHEFYAELRLYTDCKALQGQVIPRCYGSGHVEGSEARFIIVSYEGEPLQEWSSETRIEAEELLRQLHQAGFHHHDIKPDNVVANRTGRLKLIDFGLSSRCDDSSCDIVE